jgi:hypothetical protein
MFQCKESVLFVTDPDYFDARIPRINIKIGSIIIGTPKQLLIYYTPEHFLLGLT